MRPRQGGWQKAVAPPRDSDHPGGLPPKPPIRIEQARWQKCPVCLGKTTVPAGFYAPAGYEKFVTSLCPETCRSCDGKGIVR